MDQRNCCNFKILRADADSLLAEMLEHVGSTCIKQDDFPRTQEEKQLNQSSVGWNLLVNLTKATNVAQPAT